MSVLGLVGSLLLLAVLSGLCSAEAAAAGLASVRVVAQQPVTPLPTIPPLVLPTRSTNPALPPASAPAVATATVVRPLSSPTVIATVAPTVVPPRPTATLAPLPQPAAAGTAPRAGGFPLSGATLVFAGSAAALGTGLMMWRRSRSR